MMSNEQNPREKMRHLFFDFAIKRQISAERKNQRFVYYTRADTALKILGNQEIWLRSASLMNDSSEIRYGMSCMEFALDQGRGERRLHDIFDKSHPEIVHKALEILRRSALAMFHSRYICCLSEHRGNRSDRLGRLSMWRAYGGTSGVALVFSNKPLLVQQMS